MRDKFLYYLINKFMKWICKQCWEIKDHDNPLIARCKKCTYLNYENNKSQTKIYDIKKTPIKKVWRKRIERIKNWWSEADMYRKILIDRQINWCLKCEYCWKEFKIEDAWPTSFAHVLSKWMYKHLRLFENNIAIVCNDISMNSCHTKLDSLVTWNKLEIEKQILNWMRIDFEKYKINII